MSNCEQENEKQDVRYWDVMQESKMWQKVYFKVYLIVMEI